MLVQALAPASANSCRSDLISSRSFAAYVALAACTGSTQSDAPRKARMAGSDTPSPLRQLGAGCRSRATRVKTEIQAPRRSSGSNHETRVLADGGPLPDEDAQPRSCGEPALKAPQPHDPRRARACHGRERAPASATAGSDARTKRRAYREDADERSPWQHRAGDPDEGKWAQHQRAAAGRRRAARRRRRWRWRRRSRDDHLACGHRLLSVLLPDPQADGVRARLRK
jgi:hypothetical protein